jgi:hypothetical protein
VKSIYRLPASLVPDITLVLPAAPDLARSPLRGTFFGQLNTHGRPLILL